MLGRSLAMPLNVPHRPTLVLVSRIEGAGVRGAASNQACSVSTEGSSVRKLNGLNALGLSLTPASFPVITDNQLVQWELVPETTTTYHNLQRSSIFRTSSCGS